MLRCLINTTDFMTPKPAWLDQLLLERLSEIIRVIAERQRSDRKSPTV
jgi:hypothetical protein